MRAGLLAIAWLVMATQGMAQDAGEGGALFQHHCAMCHGPEGRGNGPMAPELTIQPSDLATMTARNGGVFPMVRAAMRIDGRDPLVSHGSPMPVYGAFLAGRDVILKAETGQPLLTSAPVADLIAWLQTIQE